MRLARDGTARDQTWSLGWKKRKGQHATCTHRANRTGYSTGPGGAPTPRGGMYTFPAYHFLRQDYFRLYRHQNESEWNSGSGMDYIAQQN